MCVAFSDLFRPSPSPAFSFLGSRRHRVVDASGFDYASFSLRRPVPCPAGTYCHPGSSSEDLGMHNFTMPQPCLEVSVVASCVAEHESSDSRNEDRAEPRPRAALSTVDVVQW